MNPEQKTMDDVLFDNGFNKPKNYDASSYHKLYDDIERAMKEWEQITNKERDEEIKRLNNLIEQLMSGQRLQVIRNDVGNYTVITKTD